jgi:dGTPase
VGNYVKMPLMKSLFHNKLLATDPLKSIGRANKEDEINDLLFINDRNKIIFSSSFRRLEYKTQVFVNHSGDHYRNRLTHSLEVAAIAKQISKILNLNEDLAESISLAHDLGHPPFGHAGEDALDEAMKDFGGFDHNFQTLKVIAILEKYSLGRGLNLSYEVIEGIIKHNGPLKSENQKTESIIKLFDPLNIELHRQPSLEAQVASLADDIAYCSHDIDDGLRAGFINIEQLLDLNLIDQTHLKQYATKEKSQLLIESIRQFLVEDLLSTTTENIDAHQFSSAEAIKKHNEKIASFSSAAQVYIKQLRDFLMNTVYRHYQINRMRSKAKYMICDLFNYFVETPESLPTSWKTKAIGLTKHELAQLIGDYIAGMTDRFVIDEYKRIFDPAVLK